MKKYSISAKITISAYTEIEANSEIEALELAKEREEKMSVHSNNGDSAEYEWMIDELDGTPYDLTIE
jgi:hypothetical protein